MTSTDLKFTDDLQMEEEIPRKKRPRNQDETDSIFSNNRTVTNVVKQIGCNNNKDQNDIIQRLEKLENLVKELQDQVDKLEKNKIEK